jgi:hypothetical protein
MTAQRPQESGVECEVCGEPYDPVDSGCVMKGHPKELDAVSWVKVCYGKMPQGDWYNVPELVEDITASYRYVHKDTEVDSYE